MGEFNRDLSQNPCHMCMPMGGILALKGIEGAMPLLHGSQGCSTYMRRHIAEHFNEPVDVASSALNEKGTVYGGKANLKKAMDNVRRVYQPKLIGILTTCLAETIGEDIRQISSEYQAETECECRIITAATPGYGGTHTEGYWRTLKELLAQLTVPATKHERINIIVPAALSPADLREIKQCLERFGAAYTLLPDISETMDRPYEDRYGKMADGGTPLDEIAQIAGALATLELGGPVDVKLSPGQLLQDVHGVPLYKLPIPIGLANSDQFIEAISTVLDKPVPQSIRRQRGLLMDAMIDAHKHSFQVRPVLFGDPELVFALAGFCAENGMFPGVVATGGGSAGWRKAVADLLADSMNPMEVIEETDMSLVRTRSEANQVNLAVGPSVGRYLEEQADIPLVRIGFPIQDRLGAQRILSVGYQGTALLLDKMVNCLLERKHKTYRSDLFQAYYQEREVARHELSGS